MRRAQWSAPTSREETLRRVGGRRRYNRERREAAEARRFRIRMELWGRDLTMNSFGVVSALARYFGVHKSTICRDFRILEAAGRGRYFEDPLDYDPAHEWDQLARLNAGLPSC